MFETDCYHLGYILKNHGFKGDLRVKSNLDLSEEICKKWESIFFRIDGILVPFFIENISLMDSNHLLIKFEDIDDDKTNFKGIDLFVDKELYSEISVTSNIVMCIGFQLIVQNKVLGVVSDVLEYPAQQIFEVQEPSGKNQLIPINPDWIVSVSTEQQEVVMNLPDGLLDLN